MRVFICLVLVCVLTACAGNTQKREEFAKQLDTWKGVSEEKLVEHFGIPDKSYEHKGIRYLGYMKYNTSYYSGYEPASPAFIYGGTGFSTGRHSGVGLGYSTGGRYINYYCKVTFQIKNDKVVGHTSEGNYCR